MTTKDEAYLISKIADAPILFVADHELKYFYDEKPYDALVLINTFLLTSKNNNSRIKSFDSISYSSQLYNLIQNGSLTIDDVLDQLANKY